jgi:hypothetical protein
VPLHADCTIISAADHRYFRTLCQLLLSAERHGAVTPFEWVILDLGLTDTDRARLDTRFPWVRVERFAFDRHPPHVRRIETCAWKPVAIDDVLRRRGGSVLWLDSATILQAPLSPIFTRIARDGVLTLVGQSPIRRWCHEATRRFMGITEEDADRRCRAGGVLGFDGTRPPVRALVARWRACALVESCIDPPGANRANHRYDQALLSNLLYPFEREHGFGLAGDEIDIGSIAPARWVSTRNTVAPWIPLALDPIVRLLYAVYKRADRAVLRARRSSQA